MSDSSVFCYSKWTPSTMWLEGLNFQPQTQTSGREKGLDIEFSHMANDLIRCAYVIKSHIKTLNHWGSRTFWVGEHINELVGCPSGEGMESLRPPSPKTLVYVPLPFGCSWVVIFYNETVTVSIALSWGLWIVSANYWIWGGGHGNAGICSQPGRSVGGWWPHLLLTPEVGDKSCGTDLTYEVCANLSELKCRTPTWCQRIAVWNILVLWQDTFFFFFFNF